MINASKINAGAQALSRLLDVAGKLYKVAAFLDPVWQLMNKILPKAPQAPMAPISIERLPAAAWEKMGLVVGQGGGMNHARETARNTKNLVTVATAILMKLPSQGTVTTNNPFGKTPFGNAMYAQP
jgi:hypothetical protein